MYETLYKYNPEKREFSTLKNILNNDSLNVLPGGHMMACRKIQMASNSAVELVEASVETYSSEKMEVK